MPLADLLPTLLHYAGGADVAGDAPQGWALSRLGGMALDSSRTTAQLDVRDGELLYLRPRGGEAPMLVFDDVVDAVATSTMERPGRWRHATTRVFGLGLGVTALLAGAVAVLLAGPPQLFSGLIALLLAAGLLAAAVVLARAVGDSRAGVAIGAAAMAYAGVGGLLTFAGDRTLSQLAGAHVLIAVTAVLVVAVVAAIGVADAAPLFLATGLTAIALDLTMVICLVFGAAPAAAAAIVATLAFGLLPALPMLAYRMGRLPIPTVPTEPEQLKKDTETVDGERVLARTDRADGFLTGMLGALAAIGSGTAVATATAEWAGLAFASVLGLLLLIRARMFRAVAQRLSLLCAGVIALAAVGAELFGLANNLLRLTAILGGIVALAGISIGYGLARPDRRRSPVWGRLLDILEIVLILGLVPLAVWVSGLYSWIRSIRG